jgi:hypothetical protein
MMYVKKYVLDVIRFYDNAAGMLVILNVARYDMKSYIVAWPVSGIKIVLIIIKKKFLFIIEICLEDLV